MAGEKDLIDLELAKNKHGPRDEHVYLKIDRASQSMWQADYEARPPESAQTTRTAKAQEQARTDAVLIARVIRTSPGVTMRSLWSLAAVEGVSKDRTSTALAALGDAVIKGSGPRGATPMTLDESQLPAWLAG